MKASMPRDDITSDDVLDWLGRELKRPRISLRLFLLWALVIDPIASAFGRIIWHELR